jgi:hypothetical protein
MLKSSISHNRINNHKIRNHFLSQNGGLWAYGLSFPPTWQIRNYSAIFSISHLAFLVSTAQNCVCAAFSQDFYKLPSLAFQALSLHLTKKLLWL